MKKIFLLIIVGILLIGFISASYCCEKNTDGAWCMQEEDKEDCDLGLKEDGTHYLTSQTGCESTKFCKMGTCIDVNEGTCSPNSPQVNCKGTWVDKYIIEIPQCKEACCVLGTQSFLDTLIGCKKQSGIFGLETIFKEEITNEFECKLLSATNEKGACVYDKNNELGKTCKFTTEKECSEMRSSKNNVSFHEDYLCSATELNTDCGVSIKGNTKCEDGMVYFVDTCGELANIYDASKIKDDYYWTHIVDVSDVECDDGAGNKNSKTCGVCDDFESTICGIDKEIKPTYGDYICRDMDCGVDIQHGDKWCAWDEDGNKGAAENLPGSEHFVLECNDGEIIPHSCSEGDWRKKICIDSVVAGRPNAGCVVNKGALNDEVDDCVLQDNKKDCENEDKRYCLWVEDNFNLEKNQVNLRCVPKYSPASIFWDGGGKECSVASKTVEVVYKKGATTLFEWECDKNCWALENKWINEMNKVCNAVGDCGSSVNYIGEDGWYEIKDLWTKS